jgi:hypothetical protein
MSEVDNLASYAPGEPVSGPVFHYTSAAGLIGMVSSGTFWASEASSLNDLAEVRQGWEAIRRVLASMPDDETRDLLLAHAEHPMGGRHEVFVLSASTAPDDANQWRLYADAGRGYVMELDGEVPLAALSTVPAPERPEVEPGRLRIDFSNAALVTPWLHVIYDDAGVGDALNQLRVVVEAGLKYSRTMPTQEDYDVERSQVRDESYGALASLANLIKTPGFSGEHEVRVVANFVFNSDQVTYRVGAYGIVGYATLTQAPEGHKSGLLRPEDGVALQTALPLKSVRTGPLLSDEHANTLRGFLDQHDFDEVVVTHSAVPLR